MNYKNLWDVPSIDILDDSTENMVEIMKQQAQYLNEETNGKVLGKFSKIKNVMAHIAGLAAALSTEISDDTEINKLSDANALYRSQWYGFEIYNKTYKFRIFEMNLSPLYPISLMFDEGILEDTRENLSYCTEKGSVDTTFIIKSDDNLLEFLKIIFSSKKVKYILYRLQQA